MPRRRRSTPGGFVYHAMNRAAGRLVLFESSSDYREFRRLLGQACRRTGMRIIAYCLMRNHWHLLLWPHDDHAVSSFMQWVTTTHARRWALDHESVGRGAVYQSRFKAIPVQTGEHLLTVWRYIERNPLRASLVARAEDWGWSSLSPRAETCSPMLSAAPVSRPPNWLELVNTPQTPRELEAIRQTIKTAMPYGDDEWRTATSLLVGWRPRGRPKRGRTPFSDEPAEKGVRPLF
jgi:putative transposase